MKKALVIGIDYYQRFSTLHGCVNYAHSMKSVLERHSDGSVNFHVKLLTGTGPDNFVSRAALRESVQELFSDKSDIAFLYFAGHGHIEITGGYICSSDCETGNDGLPLQDILVFANDSETQNKIIVLDSCHSGIAGVNPKATRVSELTDGLTILTASTDKQYASEQNGSGIFTSLFVDAMRGPAGNLVGDVTPGSIYALIDQSLGSWHQRPVFKTNVKTFISLRKVQPPIDLADLQRIKEFFPTSGFEFPLDPSYEPELKGRDEGALAPNPENCRKFAILQKYNRLNLLVPVDAAHMWHAAMQSKSCKLTVLGEHWRKLADGGMV